MKFSDLSKNNRADIENEITIVLRRNGLDKESIIAFWDVLSLGIEVNMWR
jgi:hypothetical protein